MPTIPPNSASPSDIEPHRLRQVAESFGVDAERYDRTRPRYPEALVTRIMAASPGTDFLNVGCGTGIEARQFHAAGCTVLGVEPDARMAEFARGDGIDVEVSTFEMWEPAGRTFDAVIAGTAWHWVDPVAGAVKAAQTLRPGGLLAPFWNVVQLPSDVAEAFAAVYQRVVPNSPFVMHAATDALAGYQAMFDKTSDGINEVGGFSEPAQWRFDWEKSFTRNEWLDQMPSFGSMTQLPPDKLAEILDSVGSAIDAMGGSFTVPHTTMVVAATRA